MEGYYNYSHFKDRKTEVQTSVFKTMCLMILLPSADGLVPPLVPQKPVFKHNLDSSWAVHFTSLSLSFPIRIMRTIIVYTLSNCCEN